MVLEVNAKLPCWHALRAILYESYWILEYVSHSVKAYDSRKCLRRNNTKSIIGGEVCSVHCGKLPNSFNRIHLCLDTEPVTKLR